MKYIIAIFISLLAIIFIFMIAPLVNWYQQYFNLNEVETIPAYIICGLFGLGLIVGSVFSWVYTHDNNLKSKENE